MLGHIISKKGIEVDKEKIEMISKLPSPTNVKTVRQFLGMQAFTRGSSWTSQKLLCLFISYWRKMPNLFRTKTAIRDLKSSRPT